MPAHLGIRAEEPLEVQRDQVEPVGRGPAPQRRLNPGRQDQILATLSGPWAPVQDTLQAAGDPQIAANEYIRQAGDLKLVTSPVQFDVTAPEPAPAPGFAEQTDEVLLELGLDWDRLFELKSSGAIT